MHKFSINYIHCVQESEKEQCTSQLERALDNVRRLEGAMVEQQTKIGDLQSQLDNEVLNY